MIILANQNDMFRILWFRTTVKGKRVALLLWSKMALPTMSEGPNTLKGAAERPKRHLYPNQVAAIYKHTPDSIKNSLCIFYRVYLGFFTCINIFLSAEKEIYHFYQSPQGFSSDELPVWWSEKRKSYLDRWHQRVWMWRAIRDLKSKACQNYV